MEGGGGGPKLWVVLERKLQAFLLKVCRVYLSSNVCDFPFMAEGFVSVEKSSTFQL